MSKYKLYNVAPVRQYLTKCQLKILSEALNNDIFLIVRKYFSNGKEIKTGFLIVIDDTGTQFKNRVKKAIPELLKSVWGEVASLPGRKAETIKTRAISLCYGKTFYRKTKDGFKKEYGSYSCNTDLLVGKKWEA